MTAFLRTLCYVAIFSVLLGCEQKTPSSESLSGLNADSTLTADILYMWMTCDECIVEKKELSKLNDQAIPQLSSILNEGPDSTLFADYVEGLEAAYEASQQFSRRYGDTLHPDIDKQEYLRLLIWDFLTNQQIKAIEALREIGTDSASAILDRYSRMPISEKNVMWNDQTFPVRKEVIDFNREVLNSLK